MKKILLIVALLLGLILLGFIIKSDEFLSKFNFKNNNVDNVDSEELSLTGDKDNVKENKKDEVIDTHKKKIETIRKRLSLKGFIISGDLYSENNDYENALKNYLYVLKENQDDWKIIQKIGDTYYNNGEFKKAYIYYKKLLGNNILDEDKAILTYLYGSEITRENLLNIKKEIDLFNFSEEKEFYYKNSLDCVIDFHECKVKLNEYFETNTPEIEELIDVKKAIDNYRSFQVEELYYKNALIIAVFFEHKNYRVAIDLGKKLLDEKPHYRPILQIMAKSYYELTDYENAKDYIGEYYEYSQDDVDAVYMLGVVKQKLEDYLISNVFLQKTLELGIENKVDVYRKMIYNFYHLGESEKMLGSFKGLIDQGLENLTEDDIRLSIYYHIINDDLLYSEGLARKAIEFSLENSNYYSYLGWILKEKGSLDESKEALLNSLKLDDNNAMANLNMGLLELELKNKVKAKLYFKKTIKLNGKGDFGELANTQLDLLDKEK